MTKSSLLKANNGWEVACDNVLINKDIKIQFESGGLRKNRLFSIWFNSDFIKNNYLKLPRDELDKVNKDKKKSKRFLCGNFFLENAEKPNSEEVEDEKDSKNDNKNKNSFALEVSQMSNEQIVITALRLQDNLIVRNRGWKDKIYEDCITGSDACKWLLKDGGFKSVQEAVLFGNMLIKEGVLYNVKRADEAQLKDLIDGPFFYRFNTQTPNVKN